MAQVIWASVEGMTDVDQHEWVEFVVETCFSSQDPTTLINRKVGVVAATSHHEIGSA